MTAKEDLPSEIRFPNIESTYHLKWVQWNSGRVPIVMQRINGPCPLIAIMNVLLFREKVKLPPMLEQITAHQLMTFLGECIMDSVPEDMQNNEDALLNLEQNIHDAIEILPKLQTGLDVNIRFSGISDFEYTPECIIFDLLRIPLFHGWLSDPSMPEVQRVVGNLSYNQLVDSIITGKTSIEPEIAARVLIAEDFLEKTASQLTHYGLSQLKDQIKDNELGILFRNNHFVTLFKRDGNLYQLVTDHGFLTESIIWETLDNIEGDGKFVDCNFETIDIKDREAASLDKKLQQLENDYLMALSLKEEESEGTGQIDNRPLDWTTFPSEKKNGINTFSDSSKEWIEESDFKLAQRLQEEETRMYQAQPATMLTKPDIVIDNHCEEHDCREHDSQNLPPSPEPGPSRAESVINVQADTRTTENSDQQLIREDLVNDAQQPSAVNSQSRSSEHEDTSSCQQGLADAIVEQSCEPSRNAVNKLHSSASECLLADSDYSHLGGNPENQSHPVGTFDEDLETRQRRASHNQSILAAAAAQVPTVDARLHHQQNSLPGRPNSSKLPRAPLRSSDNNKSVCTDYRA